MSVGRYLIGCMVVEAVQFKGDFEELEKFVGGDAEYRHGMGKVVVATRLGPLWVSYRDYVVKDPGGRFFTYAPDEFVKLWPVRI